jgi:hypothetical protein
MTNKSPVTVKFFFAVLFFLCLSPSRADAQEPKRYGLPWDEAENVRRYEVIVEIKQEDGSYTQFRKEENAVASPFVLPLLPWTSRYKVIYYDKAGKPDKEKGWMEFTIPLESGDSSLVAAVTETDEETIEPNGEAVTENKYEPPLFFIRSSWAAFLPLSGTLNPHLGYTISVPGPRLAIEITGKGGYDIIRMGGGFVASWFYLNNFSDDHRVTAHMEAFDLYGLMEILFPKVILSIRYLGLGLTILTNILAEPEKKADLDEMRISFELNTGVSGFWLINKNSYIETGIDVSFVLVPPSSINLRPCIGFGMRL